LRSADPRLLARWGITIETPLAETELASLFKVVRGDGTRAVLKLADPHMEGLHEAEGLRFWRGSPTVRLFEHDPERHAMLIEACEPGTTLRELPESEQDDVIASLLRQLWSRTDGAWFDPYGFRHLSEMLAHWSAERLKQPGADSELTREGLRRFEEMSRPFPWMESLLATDLHAGNVLRAERKPWLVIDPKPFVGDRAYDATQHLLNCRDRLRADTDGTIERFSALLDVSPLRVRSWLFARVAAEPRDNWDDEWMDLANALKP